MGTVAADPFGRVAFFGDLSGWAHPLADALTRLGADPDAGTLPEGLTVVQLGDVPHKGTEGEQAVELIDRFVRGPDAGRWYQLVGNHEANYLHRRFWDGPGQLPGPSADVVRSWRDDGLLSVAVAADTPAGTVLASHAGVTHGLWAQWLARDPSAAGCAARMNRWLTDREPVLWAAGWMHEGLRQNHGCAGPLWAAAGSEVYSPWHDTGRPPPFGQVHGHTAPLDWADCRWWADTPTFVRERALVDAKARTVTTPVRGRDFVAVDPGFGRTRPDVPLCPYVVAGTVAASSSRPPDGPRAAR